MKKHYTLYNIGKLLILSCVLLLGGTEVAMGQRINPQPDKTFPQENVPTLVDTIYIDGGESRTLTIPNNRDYYYIRWYRKGGNGSTIDKLSINQGSSLDKTSSGDASFFWLNDIGGDRKDAFEINYTSATNLTEDSVFCDLSFNVDGLGIKPSESPYTEPTIGKRYKFYIKNADEMRKRLNSLSGEPLETIHITVPKGATNVNLQMNMAPENYYWNNSQGNDFQITGVTRATSDGKLIKLGNNSINTETTVNVYALYNRTRGPLLAKYILTPQENSGFMTEREIQSYEDRNPANNEDKYQQVGVVDFDYGGPIQRGALNANNNMSSTPIDPSTATYSFMNPMLKSIYESKLMPEDSYGLYRSANVPNISERDSYGSLWAESYLPNGNRQNKSYGWYYTNIATINDRQLFDRTYHNTNSQECGYFCYVNASKEAGRVVTIPIEGTICPNTELTVVAWVADITNIETPPNVNLVLHGKNTQTGESGILHRFSSGDMSRSNSNDRAIWKQLCYKITISSEMLGSYDEFSVEFQNNTPNSDGGDYAIDDIRIYKTLPNISVRRKDACDASTLYVSSDYATILRNMGWKRNSDVLNVDELNDVKYRKYRYGLMGANPYADIDDIAHTNIGNVYYSFAYPGADRTGADPNDWVVVRKDLKEEQALTKLGLDKTMRVFIPTNLNEYTSGGQEEQLPTDVADVPHLEIVMNVRAMNDFIADTKRGPEREDDSEKYWSEEELKDFGVFEEISFEKFRDELFPSLCKLDGNTIEEVYWEKIVDNTEGLGDAYTLCIRALYEFLEIPRIHCPWTDESKENIFLGTIDVANTDLRYRNEIRPGETQPATGEYRVVLFSAREVAEGIGQFISLQDACTLISDFTVEPATTITIKTEANASTATCAGALRKVEAVLNGYDANGNPIDDLGKVGISYLFDWFLGSQEAYEEDSIQNQRSLKYDLETFRGATNHTSTITVSDLDNWDGQDTEGNSIPNASRIKERLKGLLTTPDANGNILLRTGEADTQNYDLLITGNEIIAMPYVYSDNSTGNYVYCSNETPVNFEVADADTPQMFTGFANVQYPIEGSAALRLGQLNLGETTSLHIPVRGISNMVTDETPVGVKDEAQVLLQTDDTELPVVGTVSAFKITSNTPNANIPIKWNEDAKKLMKEGQSYELLIPFVQFDGDEVLANACDGLVSFTVKIVPEYLTWKGSNSDAWYNDGNWHRSTKAELYKDDKDANEDVNGNTDVENAFSPLYFSKITIDPKGSNVLTLEDIASSGNAPIDGLDGSKATSNIQYDMAVTDENGGISSYYVNKVDQIYFKPEAKLMDQHYLNYEKAWVEFEIANNAKRWMASPLQDVYAGDIYAPNNGKQETEAFKDINYTTDSYSRWTPAFYQKAWNKAIQYFPQNPTDGNTGAEEVAAVKSNWSIEYNDVRVPYKIGKGFYLSVEDVPTTDGTETALVRLPKADTEYAYEAKSSLRSGEGLDKTDSGKLVEFTDGKYTLTLDKDVDGDGTHFLVGNPFMTYLNMEVFLNANEEVLAPKYWTLANGAPDASVGTPDVDFEDESTNGTVAPMQAFFVELSDAAKASTDAKSITFTPAMMSATETPATEATTKSASATNPVITLTAERGDVKSKASLLTYDKADNGYKADEDAVVLLDSELDAPMVYTVSGSKAAQVNAVKSIRNIGLGVYNETNDEVTLTIEGLSRLAEPLYLYDAHTRKSVKLEDDSYSLQVAGDSHGRYFLRDSELGSELENTISIYSARRGQVIVSSLRPVKEIKVFGLNGSQVRQFSVNTTQYSFDLPAGIYMIHASDGEQAHTEKVIVR